MAVFPAFPYDKLCFPDRRAVVAAGECGLCQREETLVRGLKESRAEVELREAYAWFHILTWKAALQAVVLHNHQTVMKRINDATELMLMTGASRGDSIRLNFEPSVHWPSVLTPYAGLVGSGEPDKETGGLPPGDSLRAISDELSRWEQPHALEVRWEIHFSAVSLLLSQTPGGVAAIRRQPPHTIQICQPRCDCDGYYVFISVSDHGDPVWERAGQMFCGPSRFAVLSADGEWLFTDKRKVALQSADPQCCLQMEGSRAVVHQAGSVAFFDAGSGAVTVGPGELKITHPQQLPCLTIEASLAWRRGPAPRHPNLPRIVWAVLHRSRKAILPEDVLQQLGQWIPHPDNTAVAGLCSFFRWGRSEST